MSLCCGNFIAVLATLFVIIIAYFKWTYLYWYRRNLNYLEPKIPFGNSVSPFTKRENVGLRMKRHYDTIKSKGWKHAGLFFMLSPTYIVVDLEHMKNILTKDFHHFVDRGIYYNENDDPLSAHLFALGGEKWHNLRKKLTPTFTSGKIKMMFQTLADCLPNLDKKIQSDIEKNAPIDIKEVLGCFTTDIIGSCAFGLECNTFKENSPFREYGRKAFAMTLPVLLKTIFGLLWPRFAKLLKMTLTPKDVSEFFMKVVKDTIKYRQENNISRNDFLQLLIDMKNEESEGLSFEEVAAQCFVFFLAGFETSSTAMTFALYELSKRPNLQEKVRSEVYTILKKYDGKITYEAIQEMKYMDQIITETLRMYPPIALLSRKCIKDYKIPDEDVIIEKGIHVMIPVMGIHYDAEFYPEPEKFDPERFSEENKNKRHQYAFLSFGEGPRICIGKRFGLTQSKVGLASLLRSYKFTLNEKTEQPLKLKDSLVLATEGTIWLNAEKI